MPPKRKPFSLTPIILAVCFLSLYSCKKSNPNNPKPVNSASIIGKWLFTKETIHIYAASGALVRDTTDAFGVIKAGVNSYQTYSKDGSRVVLRNTDTTEISSYAISGKALTVYPTEDHNSYYLYAIASLDATSMQLESILIGQMADVWKLDPKSSYKMAVDDYFIRE